MTTKTKLRNKYKTFIYKKYSWKLKNNNLEIKFVYEIQSNIESTETEIVDDQQTNIKDIHFSPKLTVHNVSQEIIDNLGSQKINLYVFNIGLAEMFSYWKSTAAQNIEIHAEYLNQEQINWWHKLLIKGMGEYFFVNNIKFTDPDFVKITSVPDTNNLKNTNIGLEILPDIQKSSLQTPLNNFKILIPIGGGKDSSVTLEILSSQQDQNQPDSSIVSKDNRIEVGTFAVSPTQAALDTISARSIKNKIQVTRKIDENLLKLNTLEKSGEKKYLNGHVPISAFFAFLSVFTADLFGYTHIAISNERSSNEGNTIFCDREINHQYSKTYEFESDFQNYVRNYLPKGAPLYFSFLRPLYELQIAKIFAGNTDDSYKQSPKNNIDLINIETITPIKKKDIYNQDKPNLKMKKYHSIFRSCNRGQKTNAWCGECSKCLFAYVIIFPFLDTTEIQSHFGKDMFSDLGLWPIAQELIGVGEKKPLECVGTHEETIVAFYLSIKKYQDNNQELPPLLEKINLEINLENIQPEKEELKNNQQNDLNKTPDVKTKTNFEIRTKNILNAWNENNSIPTKLSEVLKKYV